MVTKQPGWGGAKRFYERAAAIETDHGWRIELDGRPIKAPSGAELLAGPAVASAIADEWNAQIDQIKPETMPITRALNTAIDRIAPNRTQVIDEIAGYAATDLVCYRADAPEALVSAEAQAWDPLLDWTQQRFRVRLRVVAGVMHQSQPEDALAALREAVAGETDLGLAALHELTSLSGSVVIGLAVRARHLDPAAAWAASRADEIHQAEQWGRDDEAEAAAAVKFAAFTAAARLAALIDDDA